MQQKNLSLILILVTISLMSCKKDYESSSNSNNGENETKTSSYSSSESHNEGQNCMSCHVSGESGEGWFQTAGTVYNKSLSTIYPNATVKLYTATNGKGTLVATIEVDKKGNFYTTETINFSKSLYPAIQGANSTRYMSFSPTTGACNSCHGVTTNKLWAE